MAYSHRDFPDPRDTLEHRTILYSYNVDNPYVSTTTAIKSESSSSSMRSSSSLSGAVDELHVPTPPLNPPPPPQRTRSLYSIHSQSSWDSQDDVAWPSSYPSDRATPLYQRQSPEMTPDLGYTHPPVQVTSSPAYSSRPIDTPTSSLFPSPFQNHISFHPDRATHDVSLVSSGSSGSNQVYYRGTQGVLDEEVKILRKEKRDLELMNERCRVRIHELEKELAAGTTPISTRPSGDPLIPPLTQTAQDSASMDMSLKARTHSRIQLLCSSNRAGNALCSWHHSRRERRAYSPRMAPPGYLNCGCTYDEALFEESLSRHGVGGYRPGENVRMDPALRRPLLRLLQRRYNYRDGDFERDPATGEWVQGEGHFLWEQKLGSSTSSTRKDRKEGPSLN